MYTINVHKYKIYMIKEYNQLEASVQAVLKTLVPEGVNVENVYLNGNTYCYAINKPGTQGNAFFALEPFATKEQVDNIINDELPAPEHQ